MERSSSRRGRDEREKDHKSRHRHHHREERRNGEDHDGGSRRSRDERAREESVERPSRKRKEHGGDDPGEKRERRRFEDQADDDPRERKERRRFEDQADDDPRERKERRFRDSTRDDERWDGGEKVREESLVDRGRKRGAEERIDRIPSSKTRGKGEDFQREEKDLNEEEIRVGDRRIDKFSGGVSNGDWTSARITDKSSTHLKAAALEKHDMASELVPNAPASSNYPHLSKVSFTTSNENEGVNVIRSDEVPGKSSTDGATTSFSGKNGTLSLDALAKAKKALQMQKELAAKMKKIPALAKISTTDTISQVGVKREAHMAPPMVSTSANSTSTMPQKLGLQGPADPSAATNKSSTTGSVAPLSGLTVKAVQRAQEVAARMGFHQDPQFAPLINMFPGSATDVSLIQKPSKPPVLRLDAHGREIDEHGNVINAPKMTNLSTLKVNINKQKKEAFQILRPELNADLESDPHFDERMGINKTKLLRPKRMSFQFVEEGKWSRQAEITRFKNQFGEAQAKELRTKQAQLAKAKAEVDINPNLIEISERIVIKEKQKDVIPEIEWWDLPILPSGSYSEISKDKWNMEKLTIYVEHPLPIQPPAEPAPPPPQPLKLTKKENKKLRTQRRLAKERDRQEMIRQGLIEPPKPKVKMSNLMKVLGTEATQDPTRLEHEIRSSAAEREQAHVDRNIARKLTPAERREKKERKLFEDSNTLETIVTLYRVNQLSHPKVRFQVDVNAQENKLTGCAVISDGICVVVVEGGKKSNKRYKNLMLKRINWANAVESNEEEANDSDVPANKCSMVWQGSVAKTSFNRFFVHLCRTEAAARKVFADAGVPHYWDLAVNYSDES